MKAEAHWAMASSEAPAQTISTMNSQKIFVRSSSPTDMLSPSATMGSMGQVAKLKMLYSGTRAQMQARIRQCSVPKAAKKAVEPRMVPVVPQQ